MRVALKRVDNWWRKSLRYYQWPVHSYNLLCHSGLMRQIEIPEGTERITAVFTKTHPSCNKFTLKKYNLSQHDGGDIIRIKETRAAMSGGAADVLQQAWDNGYRYVHFEY